MRKARALFWAAAFLAMPGCGEDPAPLDDGLEPVAAAESVQTARLPMRVSPEIDVSEIMDRGRLAFHSRRGDGSFETASAGWYARAAGASFSVVPADWTSSSPPDGGLEVTTESIERGDWRWSTAVNFAPDQRGGLTRTSGLITEWLRPSDVGIEQGWTIAERPPGSGGLDVVLDIEGVTSAETVAGGLRLNAPAGALLYGHATWIESDGDRVPIQVRWERGQLVISVPEGVVERAAFPVVLDPLIGPEVQTDPYAWIPKTHYGGRAICTSTGCIDFFKPGALTAATTVRFTLDGQPLDPQPVPAPNFESAWDVAVAGNNIAVIGQPPGAGMQLGLLDSNGAAVAPAVTLDPTGSGPSALACSPTVCLSTWYSAAADVVGQRFMPNGSMLDAAPFYIGTPSFGKPLLGVAWNGAHFLVTDELNAVRIAPDGTLLDPLIPILTDGARVASNGVDWMVCGYSMHRVVHADGTMGPAIQDSFGTSNAIAWTGSRYVIQGNSFGGSPSYALLDASGAELAVQVIPQSFATVDSIAAVPGGGAFIVTGSDSTGGRLTKINSAGSIIAGPVPLAHRGNLQFAPFLVAGTDEYLLLWADERVQPNGAVMGMRLTSAGIPLQIPFVVLEGSVGEVKAAFNGTFYGVVASVTVAGPVRAARISLDGTVLDPGGIDLGFGSFPDWIAISSSGSNFLVTVSEFGGITHGKFLASNGTVGAGIVGSMSGVRHSSAFNGTHFILASADGGTMNYRTLTPGGIAGPVMSTPLNSAGPPPSITADCVGSTCLLGSSALLATPELFTLPLATVQHNGVSTMWDVQVDGAGDEFLAVGQLYPNSEIVAARFTVTSPPAQVGEWFPVTQTLSEAGSEPTVATLGDGGALIAYRWRDPFVETDRVILRSVVLEGPPGTACTAGVDCASGFCADGVCCDQTCGGSETEDCQACAAALGASADGVCTVLAAGSVCRDSEGECDVAEACDGSASSCPVDAAVPEGATCGAAPSGACDAADTCEGTVGATALCAEQSAPNGTPCGAGGTCQAGECNSSSGGGGEGGAGGGGTGGDGAGGEGAAGQGAGGDGGSASDGAGSPNGGTSSDGGSAADGDDGSTGEGCSCEIAGSSRAPVWPLLLLALFARRKRAAPPQTGIGG